MTEQERNFQKPAHDEAESLELNKETLQDLDVLPQSAEVVKGGAGNKAGAAVPVPGTHSAGTGTSY